MFAKFEFRLIRSGSILMPLVLFCLQLSLRSQASAQPTAQLDSLFYSEAPVFFENGVKKSNAIVIKFKDRVINLSPGVTQGSSQIIDPSFPNVINFVNDLESKYQNVTLHKQISSAAWGDTIRISRRTGLPVRIHDMSQLFKIKFSHFVPIDSIIDNLEKLPQVEYAHQPIQAISFAQPNDPRYNSTDQWNLFKVNAAAVWDITKGTSNIVVGIIDGDGVDRTHPDLSSQFITGKGDLTSSYPYHGNQVAGVVAAATDNGIGIASLGWNIKMIGYNWDTSQGEEGNLANKIQQAIDDNVNVIVMSFGTVELIEGCGIPPAKVCKETYSYTAVQQEIQNAIAQDIVVVVATGNDTQNPGVGWCGSIGGGCNPFPWIPYPAAYTDVIGVSATDQSDNFVSGYNYETANGGVNDFIDVVAPGVAILTTTQSGYLSSNGTFFLHLSSPRLRD